MRRIAVGVDVGGSGIKVAVVDVDDRPAGRTAPARRDAPAVDARRRRAGDHPDGPARARGGGRSRPRTAVPFPIGVGMPSVVIDGVTKTAANIDPAWVDYDLGRHLRPALKAAGRTS